MNDLVKRLRESGCTNGCNTAKVCICAYNEDAADEIERLEKESARFRQALLAITNQVTVDYLLSDKDIARLALEESK